MPVATAAKCTFFYQQLQHGWSETYYTLKTISDAYDACVPLGNALINMRGNNTAITGLRISLVPCPTNQGPANRSTQLFPAQPNWGAGTFAGATGFGGDPGSDAFSASVLMRCIPSNPTIGTKSIFMGGFPDIYDRGGGQVAGTLVQFFGTVATRALQQALAQGSFGWLGQTTNPASQSSSIKEILYSINNVPYIKPTGDIFVGSTGIIGVSGVNVPVRISGIKQPGNLNGIWPVRVNSANEVHLLKPFAHLAWDGTGTISFQPKNFIPFINAWVGTTNPTPTEIMGNIYAEKIAKRKRGRPFGSQAGRRRNIPVS